MTRIAGVDVGGTFTDVFLLDEGTGRATVRKVPTSRPDQSEGFLAGLGDGVDGLTTIVHGTTAGTNALLERKGARVGVITTQGFRDVLEMRRRDRPRTWGLRGIFVPVVARPDRLEVPERTLADGTVEVPVDVAAVGTAARALLDAGCTACAVLFVNAYAEPSNEAAAVAAVRAVWPNPHVAASHEILPEIREFERFSTTALNAYLQPELSAYLERLSGALTAGGFGGEFLVVQSNGGVMSAADAGRLPVRTALSGPAAGVIAAAHIATEAGYPDVITGDVGGTSFDVSLVKDGVAAQAAQTSIDFGLVIRAPMTEIATIGAGGGSIAWVDRGGLLNIGPESAGSTPGPAAYGRGNDRPTVTDANVVLGRIDADTPIGDLPRLDADAAGRAIDAHVGTPLGLSREDAAEAILTVANARMAGALRLMSIERGHDPTRFAYMPFGGGGALHACAMLREVGIGRAVVPRHPGVTSALGCVIADMRADQVQTLNVALDRLDEGDLAARVEVQRSVGQARLDAARIPFDGVDLLVELDMAYAGQTHTVAVPVFVLTRAAIADAFDMTYRATFDRLLPGGVRRVMNLRTTVLGRRPRFDLSLLAPVPGASLDGAAKGTRRVHLGGWHDAAVLDRLALPVDAVVPGPAILEQPDTTILVEPGFAARIDRFGNAILERT
ncbi:hydantoinase/oxoprolinase family protein [Jannaschia sp. LMIT008]|uniref:hydantoinase/oxoprolinase family protein n=1 Tax=Jannaschia maritima TaxID=3032585 RepID=UPI0028123ABD|nr:hydantoinase/oxoprolinase family protein [Jannaschia sp. LMIT008]